MASSVIQLSIFFLACLACDEVVDAFPTHGVGELREQGVVAVHALGAELDHALRAGRVVVEILLGTREESV